jgi:hypothetical protein
MSWQDGHDVPGELIVEKVLAEGAAALQVSMLITFGIAPADQRHGHAAPGAVQLQNGRLHESHVTACGARAMLIQINS